MLVEEMFEFEETSYGLSLVKYIGRNDIKEITIPNIIKGEAVQAIGDYAFYGCKDIESITISEGIKFIGSGTFAFCTRLKTVDLPESFVAIGVPCKSSYSEDTYKRNNDDPELSFYGSDGAFAGSGLENVIIPNNVNSIGSRSFLGCHKLKKIVLPECLGTIEDSLFNECDSLREVVLPKKLKAIGESAFSFCRDLTELELPDGLQKIQSFAFNYCSNLMTISIPDTVSYIGERAFDKASNILSISCNENSYAWEYALEHDINHSKKETHFTPHTLEGDKKDVKENMYGIKDNRESEKANHLQDSMPTKETCAKDDESGYTPNIIGDEPRSKDESDYAEYILKFDSLGEYAYYRTKNCTLQAGDKVSFNGIDGREGSVSGVILSLEGPTPADFPTEDILYITEKKCMRIMDPYAYERINGGIRIIQIKNSFNPKEIVIPSMIKGEKVIEIGDFVFANHNELEKVEISEGIERIGKGTFFGCGNLKKIDLPNSLKSIGLDIPTSFSREYENTFKQITKANGDQVEKELEEFPIGTFMLSGLITITVPDNVNFIGPSCFAACKHLKSLKLPDNLNKLDKYILGECESLTKINFPQHLKEIGYGALLGCEQLTEVNLPNGLHTIDCHGFSGCYSLRRVYIPDTVKKIDKTAFHDDSLMIFCDPGSYAWQYAENNYILHVESELYFEANLMGGKTEEDSKSSSTIKADPDKDLENLYLLARQAKDEKNFANAAKYYELILTKDIYSWEAAFYAVYFNAREFKNTNIEMSANSVANCLAPVLKLIKENEDNWINQSEAINDVVSYCNDFAQACMEATEYYYLGLSENIRGHHNSELISDYYAAFNIYFKLGDALEELFAGNDYCHKFVLLSWKTGISMRLTINSSLLKQSIDDIILQYTDKIRKYEPDYNPST